MSCPEDRVVAFLAGELTEAQGREFDLHLLGCESCWTAVQEDRQGRAALVRLREPTPAGLADRVAMTVNLAGTAERGGQRGQRKPGRRFGLALASAAAMVGLIAGTWLGLARPSSSEPPQLAMVLADARSMTASRPPGPGASLVAEHQHIGVRYYRVEDQPVLVATSRRDFPMPKHMHMAGSTSSDWMATQGKLGIYCVNARPGHQSLLVVAAMPVEALPRVAADLHLL